MKKIGILGGSFNPITKGHIRAAEYVLKSDYNFDEIWLLPCYKSFVEKKLQKSEHRIKMCELATSVYNNIKVCNFEIENKIIWSTSYTISKLFQKYKYSNIVFYFIIGSDNAININTWSNYKNLLENIPIVIIPRPGYIFDKNNLKKWYKNKYGYNHIYIENDNMKLLNISSTKFKQMYILEYDTINIYNMIDYHVLDYIKENKLYMD